MHVCVCVCEGVVSACVCVWVGRCLCVFFFATYNYFVEADTLNILLSINIIHSVCYRLDSQCQHSLSHTRIVTHTHRHHQ